MAIKSEEWQALQTEEDRSRRNQLYESLIQTLQPADVEQLISTLKTGAPAETLAALGLLQVVLRRKPSLITSERRNAILASLDALLGEYPAAVGLNAFHLLRALDPARAADFLTNHVQVDRLSDQQVLTLIANLGLFSSDAVIDRLSQLAARPGQAGIAAKRQLENLGFMSASEIQSAAREWRSRKTRESLNRLYYGYISFQGDKPIQPVLELLGPPSRREGNRHFYESTEGTTLYLESDSKNALKAMKIK